MEGLLPLLIAIGASIALSLLKKKPAQPTESDQLPQNSPWDDLLEEIERARRANDPQRQSPTSTSIPTEGTVEPVAPASMNSVPTKSTSTVSPTPARSSATPQRSAPSSPSHESVVQTATTKPSRSSVASSTDTAKPKSEGNSSVYDSGEQVFSYDDAAIQSAMQRVGQMQSMSSMAVCDSPSSYTDAVDDEQLETVVGIDESLFPGGFDLRTGVIYSEILKPKFRD